MLKIVIIFFSFLIQAQDLPHPSGHSTFKELKGQLFTFKMVPKDKTLTLEVVGIPKMKMDFSKVDIHVSYINSENKELKASFPFSQEAMKIPIKPGYLPNQIYIKQDDKVIDQLQIKID